MHQQRCLPRLKCRHPLKALGVIAQRLVEVGGEQAPVAHRLGGHAAGALASNLIQLRWLLDRQRLQHRNVDQAENGRSRADAQREREHSRDGEARTAMQLAERVADICGQMHRFHSVRNATMGSVEAARRAGTSAARAAAAISTQAATP